MLFLSLFLLRSKLTVFAEQLCHLGIFSLKLKKQGSSLLSNHVTSLPGAEIIGK